MGQGDLKQLVQACPGCGNQDSQAQGFREYLESNLALCRNCDLVYVSHVVPRQQRDESQEDNSFYRDDTRWEHRVAKSSRQLKYLLANATSRSIPATKILDIGCAGGYVLEAAKRMGLEAWGIDISAAAVEWCRQQGYQADVGLMDKLPYADGFFTHIIMKHVLEHDIGLADNLREIARVSRSGTRLYIAVPERAYWKNNKHCNRLDQLTSGHYLHFNHRSLVAALGKNGWDVVLAGKYGWNPGYFGEAPGRSIAELLRQAGPGFVYRLGGLVSLRRELVVVAVLR